MKTLKEYNDSKNLYEAFTVKLHDLIKNVIDQKKIKYHLIECRTKTQISLAEKMKKLVLK